MFFEPPWTEADEIWVECLTGEYDRRMEREKRERQARELICDTSFVGHLARAVQGRDRYQGWGAAPS